MNFKLCLISSDSLYFIELNFWRINRIHLIFSHDSVAFIDQTYRDLIVLIARHLLETF